MNTSTITTAALYDILSEKIGREQARDLVEYIDTKVDTTLEAKSKELATKSDLTALENRLLREMNIQLRWIIGLFVAIMIMFIGIYFKK